MIWSTVADVFETPAALQDLLEVLAPALAPLCVAAVLISLAHRPAAVRLLAHSKIAEDDRGRLKMNSMLKGLIVNCDRRTTGQSSSGQALKVILHWKMYDQGAKRRHSGTFMERSRFRRESNSMSAFREDAIKVLRGGKGA